MSYTTIQPCEELKGLISHFWTATWNEHAQQTNSTYFVTANSFTEMVFAFKKSIQQPSQLLFSSVQGQTSNHAQLPSGGFFEMFGASLYSYAVPFLFHIPTSEINDQFLSPETLLGNAGKLLTQKIELASSTQERIRILTDYFRLQLRKQRLGDSLITKAAQQIRLHNGNLNIADLSNDFCLSQKQFERRFKAGTGFNPKLYARIVRFETTLYFYSQYTNLTEAAHANGYYDQAHFIHDFKTFAGYSPKKFLELSGY